MSAPVISKSAIEGVVADVVADTVRQVAAGREPTAAGIAFKAAQAGKAVSEDPRIAPALEPVSRLQSETIRGIVIAAGAPLIVALCRVAGVEVADGDAATIVTTLISLAGAAYAWYGRETTTRPLA